MTRSPAQTTSSDFLLRMAQASRLRLNRIMVDCDESRIRQRAQCCAPAPVLTLSMEGFDLIAEVKKKSPSVGQLAGKSMSPAEQAQRYSVAGAAAISVLTEPEQFAGALIDLEDVVSRVSGIPAMRKDFLVSPYQVLEARAAGAGGVLLIAAMLNEAELRDMLQTTLELGMFALVEAFDPADLDLCLPIMESCRSGLDESGDVCRMLIGINCRDLRTLKVDFPRFESMAGRLPGNLPWVAESGIETAETAAQVALMGYRLALVGTALMRSADPTAEGRAMIEAGRNVMSRDIPA